MRLLTYAVFTALLLLCTAANAQRSFEVDILRDTFGFDESTKMSVEFGMLNQGCSTRDCIPSIDNPKYVSAEEAGHVADDAIVITLSYKGEYRAYPARILDHHEIVNDTIAGDPIAITWCPLCGSAVGIHREVGGVITEFGVSGVLYNSDLVLYDRATETLWDQIEARGIVGPLTGVQLALFPVSMAKWARWRAAHPDTLILSSDTGFDYDYTQDHYGKYRSSNGLMFPVRNTDERISAKTVVFGFDLESGAVAYPESLLSEHGTYRHELGGTEIFVTLHEDGSVSMQRNGQLHAPIRLFWFAWFTFHPETELIR